MGGNTFNKRDMELISKEYFEIIKRASCYIELRSKCTGHCWIIYKPGYAEKYNFWLYHKHGKEDQCYHLHRRKKHLEMVIREIQNHDLYQVKGRNTIFENNICTEF